MDALFSPNNRSLRFIIGIVAILWSSTYSTYTYIYCGDVLYANDCTIGLLHILWGFSDFAFLSCFLNMAFVASFCNRDRQLQRAYLHKIHDCEYTIACWKIHESHPWRFLFSHSWTHEMQPIKIWPWKKILAPLRPSDTIRGWQHNR